MQRSDYLIRKVLFALVTLIVVIVFNFFLFRILPGDPVKGLIHSPRMTREAQERIRATFGLDRPVWLNFEGSTVEVMATEVSIMSKPEVGSHVESVAVANELLDYGARSDDEQWILVRQLNAAGESTTQGWVLANQVEVSANPFDSQFVAYLRNLLKGNLGVSFASRQDVGEMLAERVWRTVVLLAIGEVVAVVIGVALGIVASWRRGSKLDTGILLWGLFTWSIPTFFFGIILVIVARGHLPTGMMVTAGLKPEDGWTYWLDVGKHLILPTLTMGIGYISMYLMVMRSSVVEVLSEDYILTAKAKGLSTFQILRDHALKNAMLPMVTTIMLTLGYTVSGGIQVETVFSWPGIGRLIYDSVGKQDYPVLQGAFLLIAVSVIAANFLSDLLYSMLDPRVKAE
jgi:peptide/nickel transport system permease protein